MATGNIVEEIFKLNVDVTEQIKNLQSLSGAYQKITEEQRKQIVELKTLEEKERQLLAARARSVNPSTQIKLTQAITANKKEIDSLTKSVALFAAETEEATIETNALAQSVSNAFKSTAVTAVKNEVQKLNSVYDTTRLRYSELTKAQAELTIRGRENGIVFKAIKQEAEQLRAQLDRVGGGFGDFQRNGSNAFGSLQNSVNQVSRELPAFAVNANTGFLAISNNLPILFDALARVRQETAAMTEEGKKAPSVLSQLGKAVFSVGSLMSVGVTLLTIYGGELVKVLGGVFDLTKGFELQENALKTLNEETERQIKIQGDLLNSLNNTNKEIAKLGLGDVQDKLLDSLDKAFDKFDEIEKKRRAAIILAVTQQLQAGKNEVKAEFEKSTGLIAIRDLTNKKTIRLDAELRQIKQKYSSERLLQENSTEEKALQNKIDAINKENKITLDLLNANIKADQELINASEEEKAKIRERFSAQELIRQRSIRDELIQFQIDNIKFDEQREIEQAQFDFDKANREIDLANETEAKKLAIAKANFAEKVRIEKATEKDQRQLNFNLIKLNQDFSKEVARIRAENIQKEQQIELRLRLEEELFRKLDEIREKHQKELDDKIKADVKKTNDARNEIILENHDYELYLLELLYKREQELGKKANKEEKELLKEAILNKKIAILEEKALQDIANLDRNESGQVNAAEQLAIETKLQHDIAKLRLQADALEDKRRKENTKKYIDYLSQIIKATIDATQKIIALKISEVDAQRSQQEKRVEEAKRIADRGNAELLELEQKRLDDLNKQREKFVRQQQALAAVELIANTAIAVSKAAAEGGVAAGVTIAAALIALVAGLASARSIASQAAYYDGGEYDGSGYTGDGNARHESKAVGPKPYIYHKKEFIFNNETTRQYRDIFHDVHNGNVDLNEWKKKVDQYDQLVNYKAFTTSAPIQSPSQVVNVIQFKGMENKMEEMISAIHSIQMSMNIDEDGFNGYIRKGVARRNKLHNLTTIKP